MQGSEELANCDIKIYDTAADISVLSEVKEEILGLIESRLTPDSLARLSETRKGLFPGDAAIFKLAKLAYHIRDLKNCKNYLAYLLRGYPLSEYYRDGTGSVRQDYEAKISRPAAIGLLLPLTGPNAGLGELVLKGYGSQASSTTRREVRSMNSRSL